jgi:hypothetical protein
MGTLQNLIDETLNKFTFNIKNTINFSFTKFGDGEFECIIYKTGQNCDGNLYTEKLSEKLENSFINCCLCGCYIGKWEQNCPTINELIHYRMKLEEKFNLNPNWTHYDILNQNVKHPYNPHLKLFIEELIKSNRKKIYIGPKKMEDSIMSLFRCDSYIEIPEKNAFETYDVFLKKSEDELIKNCIYISTSGFSGRCLTSDLNKISSDITFLDFGSGLDPFVFKSPTRDHQLQHKNVLDYYNL